METKDKLNAYICPKLHHVITVNKADGVTPMFISCDKCGERASSRMYNVDQSLTPTHEWYKPTPEELEKAVQETVTEQKIEAKDVEMVRNSFKQHVDDGGLLLRKIGG